MKFPKLVIEEAKALRRHATKEEKELLQFCNLSPSNRMKCVYGLMTGECYSNRATELIEKCAKRVYKANHIPSCIERKDLNGSPKGEDRCGYWSPIEVFIAKNGDGSEMNRRLISFIKGEIKSL